MACSETSESDDRPQLDEREEADRESGGAAQIPPREAPLVPQAANHRADQVSCPRASRRPRSGLDTALATPVDVVDRSTTLSVVLQKSTPTC
jgi:hypothetical protein